MKTVILITVFIIFGFLVKGQIRTDNEIIFRSEGLEQHIKEIINNQYKIIDNLKNVHEKLNKLEVKLDSVSNNVSDVKNDYFSIKDYTFSIEALVPKEWNLEIDSLKIEVKPIKH